MPKLYYTISCVTLFTIFASCSSNLKNIVTSSKEDEIFTSRNNNSVGEATQYKITPNLINSAIDDKSEVAPNYYHRFTIDLKDTRPGYWPTSGGIFINFNDETKSYTDAESLGKGIKYNFETPNADGNNLQVNFNCNGIVKTIYDERNINVDDCPEYKLHFYLESLTLGCALQVDSINSIICDRYDK